MPNFTTEDLLLYLYSTMNDLQKAALENELQTDWALREKMQVLKEAKTRLERIKLLSPRQQSIDAILQYADKSSKIHS